MKVEYPSFTFNNETFIIIPGSRFSRNELKTRLKIMGIEDTNNLTKQNIIDLYESSLKNNQNKLKMLPQLRKDTDNVNEKIKMSQRQSLPPNMITMNESQNKRMNISYEINPINSREQQINIVRPIHTNKGQYSQNPFISNSISHNQSNSYFNNEYSSSNIQTNNNDLEITNSNKSDNFNNSNNNNSSFMSNQEIFLKKNNDNSIISINYTKSSNNRNNIPNFINNKQYNEDKVSDIVQRNSINTYNHFLAKQYEEDINNNLFINNNMNKRVTYQTNNDKNNINNDYTDTNDNNQNYTKNTGQSQYLELNQPIPSNDVNSHNNDKNINEQSQYLKLEQRLPSNDINDYKREIYSNKTDNSQYLKLNKPLPSNDNILDNSNSNKNTYIKLNNTNDNYNEEEQNNNIYHKISVKSKKKDFLCNGEKNNIVENNIRQREIDEISTISFFSNFNNFRKYSLYKNRKLICIHTIILILILCLAISILQFINYSWDSIADFFSYFFELLTDPVRLINLIWAFFSSIFFGTIHYFYITIPLIIFAFIGYKHIKKYFLKKKILELLKKIIKDLEDKSNSNEYRAISEDDIYKQYLKNKVTYNEFVKKYIPLMRKLRTKEPRLKLISMINNEKEVIYYELSELINA